MSKLDTELMAKIKWSPYRDLGKNAGWVGTYKGKFVEVINLNQTYGWVVMYDGKFTGIHRTSRENAIKAFESIIYDSISIS